MKNCIKCKIEKDFSKFYKRKDHKQMSYRSCCIECCNLMTKKYRKNNPDKIKEIVSKIDKEQRKILDKTYYIKNRSKRKKQIKVWCKNNQGRLNAAGAKRKAAKIRATPSWLTEEHLKEIERFYIEAKELEKLNNIKYHVDHIIPLQGKIVSGLHVPWNLQILKAKDNLSKGNRHNE